MPISIVLTLDHSCKPSLIKILLYEYDSQLPGVKQKKMEDSLPATLCTLFLFSSSHVLVESSLAFATSEYVIDTCQDLFDFM